MKLSIWFVINPVTAHRELPGLISEVIFTLGDDSRNRLLRPRREKMVTNSRQGLDFVLIDWGLINPTARNFVEF